MVVPQTKTPDQEFDWIQLKKEMGSEARLDETQKQKFVRKFNENPLVPVGCLATLCALSFGLWSMKTGNARMSQTMMRARIGAQGFTVAALIIGVMVGLAKK